MDKKIIKVARILHHNSQFEMLTRFGYISNGVLHGLIGLAAMSLAFGVVREVDQSGILAPLTQSLYGTILLLLICIGLVSLGVSHVVRIILMRRYPNDDRKWPRQLSELGKGIAYSAVGLSSLTFIFAKAAAPSSVRVSEDFATHLLTIPAGVIILFLLGFGILSLGVNFVYRGISRKFAEALDFTKIRLEKPVIILGVTGYIAKGLAFVSLGYLFCQASVTLDPAKASGLDGAFKSLITFPFGAQLLLLLGLGFIVYAGYCVARGAYAKL